MLYISKYMDIKRSNRRRREGNKQTREIEVEAERQWQVLSAIAFKKYISSRNTKVVIHSKSKITPKSIFSSLALLLHLYH